MLVLTRKRHEGIRIGDRIEVTLVEIRGDSVRLGITAPRDVEVHRDEVYERIRTAEREAFQRDLQPLLEEHRLE